MTRVSSVCLMCLLGVVRLWCTIPEIVKLLLISCLGIGIDCVLYHLNQLWLFTLISSTEFATLLTMVLPWLSLSLSLRHVLNSPKPLYDFLQSSTSWKLHTFILFGVFQKLYINAGWRQQLWQQLWQTTHILSKSQIPLEWSSVQMTMINNLAHYASHNQYRRLLPVPVWKNRPNWYDLRQYQFIRDNTRTCLVAIWGNISLIPGLYWSQSLVYTCHVLVKNLPWTLTPHQD
jgi:hypothetical protein